MSKPSRRVVREMDKIICKGYVAQLPEEQKTIEDKARACIYDTRRRTAGESPLIIIKLIGIA